jgi:TonB family protein
MKTKLLILSVCCLFYCGQSSAQRRHITYFFKNSGREVKELDSADYIRTVSEPDSGSTLYNVSEIYVNNKPKLLCKSSQIEYLFIEGLARSFYPTGKKREIVTYKNGVKFGDDYMYFPNGKLYTHTQYPPSKSIAGITFGQKFLIIDCLDSTGKQLVVNGNGYYKGYDNDFKTVSDEGNIKLGLRDGEWKGGHKSLIDSLSFKEIYDNGELLSGQSMDNSGKIYTYKVREANPEFKGGINAFGQFLAQNVRYPAGAREKNIQGKVIVSFVVEKDGTLTDFKVVRNPNDELTHEALRAVKQSPNWIAGAQYGKPVGIIYMVPVSFTLGN